MQVQLEKIPQFLKVNGQFCNWKYELRDGNQTKVPYTPGTTRKASVNDPATFTAFDTVASATGYDGIGIRVHGGIVGIDLDHCIEDGKLFPWAQTIVDRFNVTYIEVSPSGKGIRIFCLLPDGFTYDTQTYYVKNGDIEVYIPGHTNRFLTITGNALTDADVVETAATLLWLLNTYMRRPAPPTLAVAIPSESYLSDETVITKASAAQNGEKFRRLWDGDITGYKSQSEADAALVATLAFWCSGDRAQMDRLFRQLSNVHYAHPNGPSSILARVNTDSADWVGPGGEISAYDAINDFTTYKLNDHKLAVIMQLDASFLHDNRHIFEAYVTDRLVKDFSHAEERGFINGTGEDMPTGILAENGGAEVGVTADAITYENVVKLFFSAKPEYRKN